MKRPWMPLYVADFLVDTCHLNATETGAYICLIMHYWANGGLPKDDRQLARISRMTPHQWEKSRDLLESFFLADWCHARIDAELAKASEISTKRKIAGSNRGSKQKAIADQLPTHARATSPSPSPSPSSKKVSAANAAADGELVRPAPTPEAEYFRRVRDVCPGSDAGGLAKKLLAAKNGSVALARAAVEQASTKDKPREYIAGAIRNAEKTGTDPWLDHYIDPALGG